MKPKMSQSFRQATVEAALKRPSEVSLEQFAKERGLGYSTLQRWLRLARDGKLGAMPAATAAREKRPADWSADEKWQAVLDCAGKDDAAQAACSGGVGGMDTHRPTTTINFFNNQIKLIIIAQRTRARGGGAAFTSYDAKKRKFLFVTMPTRYQFLVNNSYRGRIRSSISMADWVD